jgi:hypothetical protein
MLGAMGMMGPNSVFGTTWSTSDKGAQWSLSSDRLTATHDSSGTFSGIRATRPRTSGGSFSIIRQSGSSLNDLSGIALAGSPTPNSDLGYFISLQSGQVYSNGSAIGGPNGTIATGQAVRVDFAADGASVSFYVGTTLLSTVSVAANSYSPAIFSNGLSAYVGNFAPAGFVAWV